MMWRELDRRAGAPSDVYAFGVILWELLAGAHPFREYMDSTDVLHYAHIDVTPGDPGQLNASAPESLARLSPPAWGTTSGHDRLSPEWAPPVRLGRPAPLRSS